MKMPNLFVALVLLLVAHVAAAADANQVQGKITAINATYGNIDTDIKPESLAPLGIKEGDSVTLTFGDKKFDVYIGESYSDVPKGDWVAFITTSNGTLRIARNLDNAARSLGVKEGDTITLIH